MTIEYTKTQPEQSLELFCPECDMHVYQCNSCGDYFDPDVDMYCQEGSVTGTHICSGCKD